MNISQKTTETLGWLASSFAVIMFASYFDQMRLNLSGQKGSILIPISTIINCTLWTLYGIGKQSKQIIICNSIGILVSILWLVTALI